jgi:hypothetical protein
MSAALRICACGRTAVAKGLCRRCYNRQYRQRGECPCGQPVYAKGLCRRCYFKQAREEGNEKPRTRILNQPAVGTPEHSAVMRQIWVEQHDGWEGWTAERIIAALQRDARRRGYTPTAAQWVKAAKHRPEMTGVVRRFGSWNAGLRAAGLPTRPTGVTRANSLPRPIPHGTLTGYGRKCRCDLCRAANAAYQRAYQRAKRVDIEFGNDDNQEDE